MLKKYCPVCGNIFFTNHPWGKYCSAECCEHFNRAESNRRAREKYRRDVAARAASLSMPHTKPIKSLDQWVREARECNMDYGNYRMQVERFGKTFDELKSAKLAESVHQSNGKHFFKSII